MGRRERHQKNKLPPFVAVFTSTLDAPAWRAMSHGARSLYIALKRRYSSNFKNNGKVFLSQRDAAEEIGSDQHQVARWFRELQYFGFIVMTNPGSLGVEGTGKAPHWRLTEVGYMAESPTKDFVRWSGEPFSRRGTKWQPRKTEPRGAIPRQGDGESTLSGDGENALSQSRTRGGKPPHITNSTDGESALITSSPLPSTQL
jgi:hypothetical protein